MVFGRSRSGEIKLIAGRHKMKHFSEYWHEVMHLLIQLAVHGPEHVFHAGSGHISGHPPSERKLKMFAVFDVPLFDGRKQSL